EQQVRNVLTRVIPVRWPREGLVFITGCRAEQVLGRAQGTPEEPERPRYYERHAGDRRGYLAATQMRLIYQDRVTAGSVMTGVSVMLGLLALALLFFGNDLVGWLITGSMALLLWMVARIVEVITAGNVDVAFERVLHVEEGAQRMVAIGRGDNVYTLRIDDPSDFRMVAAMVSG